MVPLVWVTQNPTLLQIAATCPQDWRCADWGTPPLPGQPVVALCEERGFEKLPENNGLAIFMDSVRQPASALATVTLPIITLDAPQPNCMFLWTPVDQSLFKPLPWEDRNGVICPVRLNGYKARQEKIKKLEAMGVEIIERDDTRPYQQYVDRLCSARAVVNLCEDRKTGKTQVKGRIFETLAAGALLFEEKNPLTALWLVAEEEYFDWESTAELDLFIKALNDGPTIERHVAKNGYEAFTGLLNGERFWEKVEWFLEHKGF